MRSSSFTLVELLIVIAVVVLLVALAFPGLQLARSYAIRIGSLSNMRQIGMGFIEYAGDNDGNLPGRTVGTSDKWPLLLTNYLGSTRIYIAPGDLTAQKMTPVQLVANGPNNTSYIFNGFNDQGAYTDPSFQIKLYGIPHPVSVILLGQKLPGKGDFYMDFVEGNQINVIMTNAFQGGSNYVFADGSARYLKTSQYNPIYWCVDTNYNIPAPPPGVH